MNIYEHQSWPWPFQLLSVQDMFRIEDVVMCGTLPALRIAAENFPPGDVARSESGELSKDGHRPSSCKIIRARMLGVGFGWFKTPLAHT